MIDRNIKGIIGANIHADDTRICTDEDYQMAASNAIWVMRGDKLDLAPLRTELESLLKTWDEKALEDLMNDTDRDWFFDNETERCLRIVIERLLEDVTRALPADDV